jgi:FkbM family methyltransferase
LKKGSPAAWPTGPTGALHLISGVSDASNAMSVLQRIASRLALKIRYWIRRGIGARVISYEGVRLPIDRAHFSESMVEELYRERYEEDEASIVRATLRPGDTVLDLGAGIGFISSLCAKLKAEVHALEANPLLIPITERTFKLNGVHPRLRHAAVATSEGTIDLFVDTQFWGSSTVPGRGHQASRIQVPAIQLQALLDEIRPSFLICDIEGAESYLFQDADLSCVQTLVVEVHPKLVGWKSVRALVQNLFDSAFFLDTRMSRKNVLLFRREDEPASKNRSA